MPERKKTLKLAFSNFCVFREIFRGMGEKHENKADFPCSQENENENGVISSRPFAQKERIIVSVEELAYLDLKVLKLRAFTKAKKGSSR